MCASRLETELWDDTKEARQRLTHGECKQQEFGLGRRLVWNEGSDTSALSVCLMSDCVGSSAGSRSSQPQNRQGRHLVCRISVGALAVDSSQPGAHLHVHCQDYHRGCRLGRVDWN
jgi:hypothetical protein